MIDCDHMLNPNLIKGRSMGSSHIFPSSRIFFFKKNYMYGPYPSKIFTITKTNLY